MTRARPAGPTRPSRVAPGHGEEGLPSGRIGPGCGPGVLDLLRNSNAGFEGPGVIRGRRQRAAPSRCDPGGGAAGKAARTGCLPVQAALPPRPPSSAASRSRRRRTQFRTEASRFTCCPGAHERVRTQARAQVVQKGGVVLPSPAEPVLLSTSSAHGRGPGQPSQHRTRARIPKDRVPSGLEEGKGKGGSAPP